MIWLYIGLGIITVIVAICVALLAAIGMNCGRKHWPE